MHVYNYGTMCRAEVSDSASREAASARVAANIGRYIPLGAAIEGSLVHLFVTFIDLISVSSSFGEKPVVVWL